MVRVLLGDLFESEAQTWVNPVNCVGIMGKGGALEFKKRFPEMFEDYERRCREGQVRLGRPYLFKRLVDPWIFGVDTGLRFRRSSYGPYSEEFKQVIGRLMNNGLLEERRLGRMIEVRTGATFEDSRRAYALQLKSLDHDSWRRHC